MSFNYLLILYMNINNDSNTVKDDNTEFGEPAHLK